MRTERPRTASAMSVVGNFVWTGRALQAGFEQMEGGLAPLYPAVIVGNSIRLASGVELGDALG
jgi:hypothetical protein